MVCVGFGVEVPCSSLVMALQHRNQRIPKMPCVLHPSTGRYAQFKLGVVK
ncbi:hypothetical protein NB566_08935 [Vibrio parahaemolyticus]|nr:hypothetical protein [Vibrio parahaemolyticus]